MLLILSSLLRQATPVDPPVVDPLKLQMEKGAGLKTRRRVVGISPNTGPIRPIEDDEAILLLLGLA